MRLCIIASCTGQKAVKDERHLTFELFRQGPEAVARRERELQRLLMPAEKMYTGLQHQRLQVGRRSLRERPGTGDTSIYDHLWIVSAGYGLIPGERDIAPYECTFRGMSHSSLRRWAEELNIPNDVRRVLVEPYDLGLLLLGAEYLSACQLDATVRLGGPTLLFCGHGAACDLPTIPGLRPIITKGSDPARFSCGWIGLKGEIAARLLKLLVTRPEALRTILDEHADVLDLLASVNP